MHLLTIVSLRTRPRSRRSTPVRLLGGVIVLLLASGCSQIKASVKSVLNAPPASTRAQQSLAEHLNKSGAKLYATFWCPYCQRQEELFGSAMQQLPMVECDPNGENAQPDLCNQAGVSSYPTWQINGKLYRGMRSLEELADLSGYQGDRQFER